MGYVSGLNLWSRRLQKCKRKEKICWYCILVILWCFIKYATPHGNSLSGHCFPVALRLWLDSATTGHTRKASEFVDLALAWSQMNKSKAGQLKHTLSEIGGSGCAPQSIYVHPISSYFRKCRWFCCCAHDMLKGFVMPWRMDLFTDLNRRTVFSPAERSEGKLPLNLAKIWRH